MKKQIVQETQTIAYAASTTGTIKTGFQSFVIAGFLLHVDLAKTDAGGPTTYQDYFWRSVQTFSVTGGGRTYIALNGPDLRTLYWDTRLRLRNASRTPDMVAGGVTLAHTLPLLFTPHPIKADNDLNLLDGTAAIKADADLTINITWNAASALGANRTINSGRLRVSYLALTPEPGDPVPLYFPEWRSTVYQPPQSYAGLAGSLDLEPTRWYRRHLVMVTNGVSPADNRTDGVALNAISEIGVRTADGRTPLNVKLFDLSSASQAAFEVADDNAGVPGAALAAGAATTAFHRNPGVAMIDWSQIASADPVWGINMNGKDRSAARFAFTVDAPTNTNVQLLAEGYNKY